jgi:hypothetical protein
MVHLPIEILIKIGMHLSVYDALSYVEAIKSTNPYICPRLQQIATHIDEMKERRSLILQSTQTNPTDEMLELYLELNNEYAAINKQIDAILNSII